MRIAILSRNPNLYSTHSLYRAAFRRGHQVEVIDHTHCNLIIEKNIPQIFYQGRRLIGIDAVIPRIGASVTSYGAAVIKQFELMNIYTLLRSDALLQARDKLRCLQKLSVAGIDVPRSFIAYQTLELPALLDQLPNGPVVIKLLESTHGAGVVIAESRQSAISIIEAFSNTGNRVMVQEYIEEAGGADIRVLVAGGEIVTAMKRQAVDGEFRSNLHRGAAAVPVELSEKEIAIVKKAVKVMGIDVAGVDLLPSRRGALVMEVNASPGLEGIETTTGVDVAGAIINYVSRRVKRWKESQKPKSRFTY